MVFDSPRPLKIQISSSLIIFDALFDDLHDQVELLDLVAVCFEYFYDEHQLTPTNPDWPELYGHFHKFVTDSQIFANLTNIWSQAPKSNNLLLIFGRILMTVSIMDTRQFDAFVSPRLVSLFQEILLTKHRMACTDALFAISNFAVVSNFHLLFIKPAIFRLILGFLYYDK